MFRPSWRAWQGEGSGICLLSVSTMEGGGVGKAPAQPEALRSAFENFHAEQNCAWAFHTSQDALTAKPHRRGPQGGLEVHEVPRDDLKPHMDALAPQHQRETPPRRRQWRVPCFK
ncbi:uncharacterized protein LOC126929164 [Macaca thibetana thibetana]|uniref:uncharacterized protein LOC126929164 n=1 Tax=Macaca thibetana thibetana TaxID=257877 RepID=UPI0021BC4D74|nr:uncharacterized protein LOC126929164 [Macaca thibetana thibetana]